MIDVIQSINLVLLSVCAIFLSIRLSKLERKDNP